MESFAKSSEFKTMNDKKNPGSWFNDTRRTLITIGSFVGQTCADNA
jgi:hypothetical protein